eukprot:TRINITY_DN3000_c0_g1_i6.p1 TRINITY_DN3000_c0_g1~~TRINITY_DN3000_c0_g1_i6.p1  ORF type:complete len:833 (+),score=143.87 TRINITY_DN3000_c0_g1_i6:1823-4321(+)
MLEILFGWRKASKCKALIKCVRCRLKLLRSKREIIIRQLRDDVAQLLKNGQDESAFARVEQLFKDQNILAAYDLLDHFCEFLIINLPYIRRNKDCPNDINEAISTLIFAAARCADLPELQMLRKLFRERYGKDFALVDVELYSGNHVNPQISEKLCVKSVADDTKIRLIDEIAEEYNLELGYSDVEDSCKPLQHQQAHDPSVLNGDLGMEKQVSGCELEVIFSDKEMLQLHQKRHLGDTNLSDEKARYHSASNCKKLVQNHRQSFDNSGPNSNSIGASVAEKCASDNVLALNSMAIRESMQEVIEINEPDPSYEVFVYSDDAEDSHLSIQDNNEGENKRWLESTNSLQNNQWRQPCEEKHTAKNRLTQPTIKIGSIGSHGRKQEHDSVYCETQLRARRASLSDLHYDDNCGQKLEESGEVHDGSVSSKRYSKRRKSVSTSSRKRTISRQSELYGGFGDTSELDDFHGTGRKYSMEICHQKNCSSLSEAISMKDVEYALYYDESLGDSDVNFLDCKQKNSLLNRIKPNDDYFGREPRRHSLSNLADELFVRSGPCQRKHQKEIMSRCQMKQPSPQPHYAPKTSGDGFIEVLLNSTSHGYKYRRRSCSSCSWNHDMVRDCCLENPCYSSTSKNKNGWESSSPNRSCVTTLEGSPSSNIQLQKQENHCHLQCYPNNSKFNNISTIYSQGSFSVLAEDEASSTRRCVDSNSDMDVSNDSVCNEIASQSLKTRKHKQVKGEASDHHESDDLSHVSNSSEILQPSSTRPPYLRTITMPLPERPKATLANQTPRSASFQFQQHNRHVHPKLPDYDDLAAKFIALKKEHLQNTTFRACHA